MDVKKLNVYIEAFNLSIELYTITRQWKDFWLRDQMMRAVTSVCANLSEFAACNTYNERCHKATIALSEAKELQFWLEFCNKVALIPSPDILDRGEKISKMMWKLRTRMNEFRKTSSESREPTAEVYP